MSFKRSLPKDTIIEVTVAIIQQDGTLYQGLATISGSGQKALNPPEVEDAVQRTAYNILDHIWPKELH